LGSIGSTRIASIKKPQPVTVGIQRSKCAARTLRMGSSFIRPKNGSQANKTVYRLSSRTFLPGPKKQTAESVAEIFLKINPILRNRPIYTDLGAGNYFSPR
jgi:hypothetical protein